MVDVRVCLAFGGHDGFLLICYNSSRGRSSQRDEYCVGFKGVIGFLPVCTHNLFCSRLAREAL